MLRAQHAPKSNLNDGRNSPRRRRPRFREIRFRRASAHPTTVHTQCIRMHVGSFLLVHGYTVNQTLPLSSATEDRCQSKKLETQVLAGIAFAVVAVLATMACCIRHGSSKVAGPSDDGQRHDSINLQQHKHHKHHHHHHHTEKDVPPENP